MPVAKRKGSRGRGGKARGERKPESKEEAPYYLNGRKGSAVRVIAGEDVVVQSVGEDE